MKLTLERGATSIILHVFVLDSSVSTGAGLASLAYNTGSLACRKIRNGETISAAITLEDITTLGTYAAPTSNAHIRFKAVDNTNWPGLYEVHIHNDWVDATNTRRNLIFILRGAANMAPVNVEIALSVKDPAVRGVVGSSSTTTSIVTSSLTPAAAVADQFKGRIVIFDPDTTTANLRGQATDITANTSGGVLTVTALTTAAVSGDTFSIY